MKILTATHALLADRQNVRYEIQYSTLLDIINDEYNDDDSGTESNNNQSSVVNRLTNAIDDKIASKNVDRNKRGMDKLDTWYRQYALLQGEFMLCLYFCRLLVKMTMVYFDRVMCNYSSHIPTLRPRQLYY